MNNLASRPQVKICGLRDETTIRAMAGLNVAYIGLVFASSKRQVTPEQAAALLRTIRATPMNGGGPPRAVGVFVNPTLESLAATLAQAPLDVVQLHGGESAAFCREVGARFGVEVWRALSVQEEPGEHEKIAAVGATGDGRDETDGTGGAVHSLTGAERIAEYEGAVSAILLDTAGGGTGRTFRWELIPAYQEAARRHGLRLIVAGGLTPDNVGALAASYRPDGVDISSGVETDGVKDIDKIAAFAERVDQS